MFEITGAVIVMVLIMMVGFLVAVISLFTMRDYRGFPKELPKEETVEVPGITALAMLHDYEKAQKSSPVAKPVTPVSSQVTE